MSGGRGRRAALPPPGPGTRRGLVRDGGRIVVRCFEEETGQSRDFDFAGMPLAPGLMIGLAEAFARRTAPGSGATRMRSFERAHVVLLRFAEYVATLAWPPREVAHLAPEHVDGFYASRSSMRGAPSELSQLKRLLSSADGLPDAMHLKLAEPSPRKGKGQKRPSYTPAEFGRIASAARADLRAAAKRIREHRAALEAARAGRFDTGGDPFLARHVELLRFADEFADVPRYAPGRGPVTTGRQAPKDWVFEHGRIADIVCRLHLSPTEVAAAAVLMAAMTGQNRSVLTDTPAAHHRADGYTGSTAVAITRARKHRRGRRAHMDLVWSEVPDWVSIPEQPGPVSARDELHTPFGLYMLLHELTARSRELMGDDRLLVGFSCKGGGGMGRGLRGGVNDLLVAAFGTRHQLMADQPGEHGQPVPLAVTIDQLRMTYLELNQKPVAHTTRTLATTYLLRNHGSLPEYQKVVAAALADEVDKARARGVMLALTAADLARAAADPATVAAEYGIDADTLKKMIAGDLDTVMNACTDNDAGPWSPPGEPCRASFMQCLECANARALPRHLPIQVGVYDALAQRRTAMPALAWVSRFAAPHARLADILDQHGEVAVADARAQMSCADRMLVERFLNRELDLR